MYKFKCIAFIIFTGLIFQSCSDNNYACTDEFVMFSVTVLNPDGEPAENVEIEVRNKESGNLYQICEGNLCDTFETGRYIIMHDGFMDDLSTRSEKLIVSGTKGDLSFEEEFTFRSGSCHVEKIAGPDKITLS